MRLSKNVTDLHRMPTRKVFEKFIKDCLLPTTKKKTPLKNVLTVWEQYCEQVGYAQSGDVMLGRMMSERFQRTSVSGHAYYYCEFQEDIFDEPV